MDLGVADLEPVGQPEVHGDLRVWADADLPGLGRRDDVYVWLPPGYAASQDRYPVIYLHDGHNVFLDERSFGGVSWSAGQALTALAAAGSPTVAVAVPCHPTERAAEYTPHRFTWADGAQDGGRAADYGRFLVEELKPAVDAALRTLTGPEDTLVAGSSLGGVVSGHLWARHNDVFGAAGLFSPAWYVGQGEALAELERTVVRGEARGRVYLDVGGRENHRDAVVERQYVTDAERLLHALRDGGVPVRYVFDSEGYHFEDAWAARLPGALDWLLHGWRAVPPPYVAADLSRTQAEDQQ